MDGAMGDKDKEEKKKKKEMEQSRKGEFYIVAGASPHDLDGHQRERRVGGCNNVEGLQLCRR